MQVIKHLISYIGKIQGIGPRLARKAALHIIKNRQKEIPIFKNLLDEIYKNILPPLSLLNKTEEENLLNTLKELNFTTKSSLAA